MLNLVNKVATVEALKLLIAILTLHPISQKLDIQLCQKFELYKIKASSTL